MPKADFELEWLDENTIKGEISPEEFEKRRIEMIKFQRELGFEEVDILEILLYEKQFVYRGMEFKLRVLRSVCGLGSAFDKEAWIEYNEAMLGTNHGRKSPRLRRLLKKNSALIKSHRLTLKQQVNLLFETAKENIDWFLDVEKPKQDADLKSALAGIGKIGKDRKQVRT